MMKDLIYKDECYKIAGACFAVYNEKGCGFLEAVYQECLEIEFELQGILIVPKKPLALSYKGRPLKQKYEPDFICLDKIILEIKAVSALVDEHRAQALNYLNATGFKLGLLVNFGHYPKLEWERLANTKTRETRWPANYANQTNKDKSPRRFASIGVIRGKDER